jgi:hypothetical protein
MARTKAEVRRWLEARVGTTVADKSDARLNGQCVALIKGLMEYLGVPNPYAARGNARDAGDSYIAQGIGTNGKGWLTIVVNRNMAGSFGHIWVDLKSEANYEQNGAVALRVTKNTRPISQGQQFINFDKWIKNSKGDDMLTRNMFNVILRFRVARGGTKPDKYVGKVTAQEFDERIEKSSEFKRLVEEAKKPDYDISQHAPRAIREAYNSVNRTPTVPPPPVVEYEKVNETLYRRK